jgi:hypothetical protein
LLRRNIQFEENMQQKTDQLKKTNKQKQSANPDSKATKTLDPNTACQPHPPFSARLNIVD